jgi:cardiolipin synthase
MNLPNLITLIRILLVPFIIWLIISDQFLAAFAFFILAGVSDGADGYIAKHFQLATELGAYLDPIADKLLLVSIYLSLGLMHHLPAWLVILVATRDGLIIGAVLLARVLDKPVTVRPLMISKVNTTGQICLAGFVLGSMGLNLAAENWLMAGYLIVAGLTIASGLAYLRDWATHMTGANP